MIRQIREGFYVAVGVLVALAIAIMCVGVPIASIAGTP